MKERREAAAREREAANEMVINALEKHGALSVEQIVWKTNLAKSTVQNALDRLRRDAEVRRLDERRRVGKQGVPAFLYDIGVEDVSALKREPVQVIIRRDPLVEAFYGPYERRAA